MTLKRIKTILLPASNQTTLEQNQLWTHENGNGISLRLWDNITSKVSKHELNGYCIPQHLYFISDDDIKEGDWILWNHKIVQAIDTVYWDAKKIIATTNKSLVLEGKGPSGDIAWKHSLPQPSKSFLEVFTKEYNRDKQIKEVMVEYNELCIQTGQPCGFPCNGDCNINSVKSLKVNPKDNTITIKATKDKWNRTEIEQLLWSFNKWRKDNTLKQNEPEMIVKWMEENIF